MQTITGLFDTYEHAAAAMRALGEAGVRDTDISVVFRHDLPADPPEVPEPEAVLEASDGALATGSEAVIEPEADAVEDDATIGGEIGAGLGAAGGLLAGLGIIAIPGFGPVVAGGWLVATALGAIAGAGLGAATGSLVGALTSAGVPEDHAHVVTEGLRRGGAVVTARVDARHAEAALAILQHAPGIDLEQRRRDYELEGWTPAG
ncbi:MAG: DUF1269 domain-containing protein [Devosia sp.]|nr:DUF1269 domain-containing protein [Devosia sp.]